MNTNGHDRPLPHSPEIERNVIGAVLLYLDAAGAAEALRRLRPDQFFVQGHRYIWQRLQEQVAAGAQPDLALLTDTLIQYDELAKIPGGAGYVSSLIDGIPGKNPALVRWVEAIENKALLRMHAHLADFIKEKVFAANGNAPQVLKEIAEISTQFIPKEAVKPPVLRALKIIEILKRETKPREAILSPFLPTQGLVMLYSQRGVGKTYLSLGIALAVATGGTFLRWKADRPRGVLYVDGEMPLITIKERLLAMVKDIDPPDEKLRIITPDEQGIEIPDLASGAGQECIEQHLKGVDLLILDNLSALVREGKENEGESWLPIQGWALGLRRRGISVLFDHHAGKTGTQRGTSRREDLLDSVVVLRHPSDYSPTEGLRCEVHYEKARGFHGDDAKPFEVRLETGLNGEAIWTHRDAESLLQDRVAELKAGGSSFREIAEICNISKSRAHRLSQNCGVSHVPKV